MRSARHTAYVLLVALVATSCAETARIVSRPSGSQVQIDGRVVGVTPMTLTVPRSDWPRTFVCSVSKEGFVPETKQLTPQIGGGRVVAGILTVGLALAFKSPYVFASDTYDFELNYVPTALGDSN